MSHPKDMVDDWIDSMPDNYDQMTREQQLECYRKWEQGIMEYSVAQEEAREDR